PAPTHVFPTKTYDPSYAFNAGKVVLQVPETSAAYLHHNNAGQSGSTISIPTDLHVTSGLPFASTADAIVSLDRRHLQYQWTGLHHLWEIDYNWVVLGFHLLLSVFTVGTAIVRERQSYRRSLQSELVFIESIPPEPKAIVMCHVRPRTRTTLLLTYPTRGLIEAGPRVPVITPALLEKAQESGSPRSLGKVLQITGSLGLYKDNVEQTVALKPLHRVIAWVTICSVEGFLSLEICSSNSDCGAVVRWAIVFHPRDRHCPTMTPTQPNAGVTIHEDILHILYRGISSYYPWAPHLVGVVEIPGDIVNRLNQEEGLDVTAIVPRTAPTPATPAQIAPAAAPDTSAAPTSFANSSLAYGIDTEENNTSATTVVSAPLHFTSDPEAPIIGPIDQEGAANNQLLPLLRDLATRGDQHPQPPADVDMEAAEGHLENQPGPDAYAAEEGSAIHAEEQNGLPQGQRKTKRGGKREVRKKRLAAQKARELEGPEAGPSGAN
ncbi:hypothetical protein FRC01_012894, partial [Tulasnella sp. 417]